MKVLDLGVQDYAETWALQKKLIEAPELLEDTLILVEHLPVYTQGRAAQSFDTAASNASNVVKQFNSVPVIDIERGGKITFHGPGQLVVYPIFRLLHQDLRRYLKDLERILVDVLQEQTLLPAQPCPETLLLEPGQLQTGVWVRDQKLASIGIAVKKWVSYHGFALNITTDLRYFDAIEPCGFQSSVMTSLQRLLGEDFNYESLTQNIKKALIEKFSHLSAEYQKLVHGSDAVLSIENPSVAP